MSHKIEYKGKSVSLPDFSQLPIGVVRKARNVPEQDQMFFILEELLSAKDLAVVDTLPIAEFTKQIQGWTGGVSLGES